MNSMKLSIELRSDWHVGSGTGIPGGVDRQIVRDASGLPYLPAKTITGILRDGCEFVAQSFGEPWVQLVQQLFGAQPVSHGGQVGACAKGAKIRVRPGHFPSELQSKLASAPEIAQATTFVVPRVHIDLETGCAHPKQLGFAEVARVGAVFEAELQLVDEKGCASSLGDHEIALLVAGAAAVRRVGGMRRRGLGRCKLSLEPPRKPPSGSDWLEWLAEATEEPENATALDSLAPGETCQLPVAPMEQANIAQDDWHCITYVVQARTALCARHRVVGNHTETLDFVPGTMLLPLVDRALRECDHRSLRKLIDDGGIVVSNAYPVQADGSASWPAPAALGVAKGGLGLENPSEKVYNLFHDSIDAQLQVRGYREGYVSFNGTKLRPSYIQTPLTVSIHNSVDDASQRPNEDVGGVYVMSAIAAGTVLRGEIRLRETPGNFLEKLNSLGQDAALGTSKKDDFGWCTIEFSTAELVEEDSDDQLQAEGEFTVWLLSDLLLRAQDLGWATSPATLSEALSERLGVDLRLVQQATRSRRLEGWIRGWSRPRPSLMGLKAGSCFRFRVADWKHLTADEVARTFCHLHREGLGLRRSEGFGQLRINPCLLQGAIPEEVSSPQPPASGEEPEVAVEISMQGSIGPEKQEKYLQLLEKQVWKRSIREAALRVIHTAGTTGYCYRLGIRGGSPPNSQLGSLREAIRGLDSSKASRDKVIWHLLARWASPHRRDHWPRTVRNQLALLLEWNPETVPFEEWRKHFEQLKPQWVHGEPGEGAWVWKVLFAVKAGDPPSFPASTHPDRRSLLAKELWAFAVSCLVQTVCAAVLDSRGVGHGT